MNIVIWYVLKGLSIPNQTNSHNCKISFEKRKKMRKPNFWSNKNSINPANHWRQISCVIATENYLWCLLSMKIIKSRHLWQSYRKFSSSHSKILLLFPIRKFSFSFPFEASPSLFHSISAMTLKQLFQVISHGRLTKVIVIKFYWKPFRYDRMKSALFAHAVCGVCGIITVVERNYLRFNQ